MLHTTLIQVIVCNAQENMSFTIEEDMRIQNNQLIYTLRVDPLGTSL